MSAVLTGKKKNSATGQDSLWQRIRQEVEAAITADRTIASFLRCAILDQENLEKAVISRLVDRLHHHDIDKDVLQHCFCEATSLIQDWPAILAADIRAVVERDAASDRCMDPVLYLKGFHAIQSHRIAHILWQQGRKDFAYYLQSRSSSVFQTDIHPAARIGSGVFLDHATGLVVGETAVIEDNVSVLHSVTLGGTGKSGGDRHPKIRHGVLIGAGAKILGNIEVGACSSVAAGSVVLENVPAHMTVAGVPARIVGKTVSKKPAQSMDQTFVCGDGI